MLTLKGLWRERKQGHWWTLIFLQPISDASWVIVADHCHFAVDFLIYEQLPWNNLSLSIWHRWITLRKTVVKFKTQTQSPRLTSFCKTGSFLGFTDNFIVKLVLKSLHHHHLFGSRPNGILYFQIWQIRHTLTFLFTDLCTLEQKIEDLKGLDSFVTLTQDYATFDWVVHTTPYSAIIFKMF